MYPDHCNIWYWEWTYICLDGHAFFTLFILRSHEYHAQTMENCRTAAKMYKEKHGVDPNLAIALDTKGPEIRTGLLEGVSTY